MCKIFVFLLQDGGFDDVNSENSRGTPTSSGIHHPAVSSLRTVTSPVGSTGSRSNTPASIPGESDD